MFPVRDQGPSIRDTKKMLGFIGGGNMAEAILRGVLARGVYSADQLCVTDAKAERRAQLREMFPGVAVLDGNQEVVERADAALFAVKPQNMPDVLAEI